MNLRFTDEAWSDYLYWQETDRKILKKVNSLIKDIKRNPHDEHGIGKPERLKGNMSGYLSRRITDEHRLVYETDGNTISVISCRYHY
jgi:toxin YoeB